MNRTDPEIDDYLTRYAGTLAAFDAHGAAALWGTPGMILDDRFAGVLDDRDAMAQGLEQSYPLYRELGLADVDHECLQVMELTERISMVKVLWHFYDDSGEELTDSSAYYILRRNDDGLHAFACIQVDDAEKLQALAERRGVELPTGD